MEQEPTEEQLKAAAKALEEAMVEADEIADRIVMLLKGAFPHPTARVTMALLIVAARIAVFPGKRLPRKAFADLAKQIYAMVEASQTPVAQS